VLIASERPVLLAIYNDIAAMLLTNKLVLEALSGSADAILLAWRAFARTLEQGEAVASIAYVESVLLARDEDLVKGFARALATTKTERRRRP
jgi:hypothetical protein